MNTPYDFEKELKEAKERAPIKLPEPIRYNEFELSPVEKPKTIIENLLESSSRMVFGGGSKTYKTWAMSDMALSIVAGIPWWNFKCSAFPVLYVNFELKPYHARERFKAIRKAKSITGLPQNLWIWNLRDRDVSKDLSAFRAQVIDFIQLYSIATIFLDPFYKLLGQHDERVSAELIPVLSMFEEISLQTDTSTVTSAHYTKGNQASKDPIDRISGGGAINRHPDALITLTNHATGGAFVVDIITRDFSPVDQFVVKWTYPLLIPENSLDPTKLKKPLGRNAEYSGFDILEVLREHDDQLSTTELQKLVRKETGMVSSTFYELFKKLKSSRTVFRSKLSEKWNISVSTPATH
jgi:AAA domain